MSGWKIVPVELTPEMIDAIDLGRTDSAGSIYYNLLAAAPAWEPSDEQCDRMFKALGTPYNGGRRQMRETMRAALKTAIGGG